MSEAGYDGETTYYKANCLNCGAPMRLTNRDLGKIEPCPACGTRHWVEIIAHNETDSGWNETAELRTEWPSWVDEQQEIFHEQRDDRALVRRLFREPD